MRYYTKILIWENKRRLDRLTEFRDLVIDYFGNSRAEWMVNGRIETDAAKVARTKINRIMDETHDIILHSGINPSITWTPPPAVGGYVRNVDLIQNIFNLHGFQIRAELVLDFIDRAIGIYESNRKSALIRIANPFFYIGLAFNLIVELPFIAIGKLGFNRKKAESSMAGRLIKGILYLITVVAAFLTILNLLGFIDPVKHVVHGLFSSSSVK